MISSKFYVIILIIEDYPLGWVNTIEHMVKSVRVHDELQFNFSLIVYAVEFERT